MAQGSKGTESLSLDQVIKRFLDSEQALTSTEERLRGLTLAEEGASAATAALEGGAKSISDLAGAAKQLVQDLRGAQKAVLDALESAKKFLESTDLKQLERKLSDNSVRIGKQLEAFSATFETRIGELETRIGDAESAKASERQAKQELAAVLSKIPDRARRKFGIA